MKITILKFTLLFLLVNYLSVLNGQYFGVDGTKWSYTAVRPGYPDKIITLESIGTEEVLGKTCNVIQRTNSSCETFGTQTTYIYYENDQVFWYNEEMDNFTVLYDFGAEVGDGWDIQIDDCTINVVIDSISYDSFNGEILKVLYPSQQISGFENYRIIERLGLEEFMFPDRGKIGCGPLCEGYRIIDPIRCYEDDQFNYHSIGSQQECFAISSTNYLVNNFDLSISPTISTSEFKVKINGEQGVLIDEISLYRLNGMEYQVYPSIESDTKFLSIPDRGLYIAVIKLNNQTIVTKKLIVLN